MASKKTHNWDVLLFSVAFISVRKFRLVTSELAHWKMTYPLHPASVGSDPRDVTIYELASSGSLGVCRHVSLTEIIAGGVYVVENYYLIERSLETSLNRGKL